MKLSTLAALACLTTVVPGCAHYPLNDWNTIFFYGSLYF